MCSEIILYDRPNYQRMQRLAYASTIDSLGTTAGQPGVSRNEPGHKRKKQAQKLSLHGRRPSIAAPVSNSNDLETVLCQVNKAYLYLNITHTMDLQINVADRFEAELISRGLSSSAGETTGGPLKWIYVALTTVVVAVQRISLPIKNAFGRTSAVWKMLAYALALAAFQLRILIELVLMLISWRPLADWPCLRDLSITGKSFSCSTRYSLICIYSASD